ncbi:MAG: Zn-dependent [Geobacteraceae bacterium]|nr:MAG: Zn-dependent [Geobacteraceae bacterium]
MKAYELPDFSGIDGLVPVERPMPDPGHGEALVKVRAASVNYRDLLVVKGAYSRNLSLPLVPFSDCAGEVVAVGEGVTRVKGGDRVAGIFMQRWIAGELTAEKVASALGGAIDGVLAEYVVLKEEGLVHLPEHLSFEEGATLPCAGVTAWHAVVECGIKPGDTVLALGTGGVSLFALQFARLAGARVIITSGDDKKLQRALGLGASDGVNYRAEPEWEKRVKALTNGVGVDCLVEVGGAGTLPKSLHAVRIGGRISLIGVLTGAAGEVNPLPVVMKKLQIQGILVGSREMFEAMNRAISVHGLRPVIDRVFPFAEARDALRHMESGAHFGKVVISV